METWNGQVPDPTRKRSPHSFWLAAGVPGNPLERPAHTLGSSVKSTRDTGRN